MKISSIEHPNYDSGLFEKYRLTYKGGNDFKERYLKQFSDRETDTDFATRKDISYVPAFAKAAVVDIQNSIFNRLTDVIRQDGSKSYQAAMQGEDGGVDNKSRGMNQFIGHSILPELLPMRTVGVYVDMPRHNSVTLSDDTRHPYLYIYKTEEIKSWNHDTDGNLISVLLEGNSNVVDTEYKLITDTQKQWRHLLLTDGGVVVTTYNNEEQQSQVLLPLTMIPFVLFELPHSLLADVADYQISMLNIASADMNYAIRANFPFYVEQYNLAAENHIRTVKSADDDGTSLEAAVSKATKIEIGTLKGRKYPQGMDRPSFLHPSPEPLVVSMAKQETMKKEIRQLVNLAVANMDPGRESAESKKIDERGLSAGLAAIGLECERGERMIAKIWAMYEQSDAAGVNYPEDYDAKSDADRISTAQEIAKLVKNSPSQTYQKEMNKQGARVLLSNRVSATTMSKIYSEIESASVQYVDPEAVIEDVETGLVTRKTASLIRHYPVGEAERAKIEHADRAAAIILAQSTAARGVPDLDPNDKTAIEEKKQTQNPDLDLDTKDGKRGKA